MTTANHKVAIVPINRFCSVMLFWRAFLFCFFCFSSAACHNYGENSESEDGNSDAGNPISTESQSTDAESSSNASTTDAADPVSTESQSTDAELSSNASTTDAADPVSTESQQLEELVDSYVTEDVGTDDPGLAIAVVYDGEIVLEKGYGLADLSTGRPVEPSTQFNLASVTKQFTAMAVAICEERGLLSYEDSLADWFPEVPSSWSTITIHHLLTHQSGIPDYFSLGNLSPQDALNMTVPDSVIRDLMIEHGGVFDFFIDLTNQDVLDLVIHNEELDFDPGSSLKYSNSGYVILAMLVERASSTPFHDFVRTNIFEPLEMASSIVYDESKPDIPNRAIGYLYTGVKNDYKILTRGDSGLFSTISDMVRWNNGMDTLVTDETLERIFSRHVEDDNGNGVGYGWGIGDFNGISFQSHLGRFAGYSTLNTRVPEYKMSVTILATGTRDESRIPGLRELVLRYFFNAGSL